MILTKSSSSSFINLMSSFIIALISFNFFNTFTPPFYVFIILYFLPFVNIFYYLFHFFIYFFHFLYYNSHKKGVIKMSFIYEDNQQLIVEIKKLMLEKNFSQRQLAQALEITPQAFSKLLCKKNFSFEDAKKILSVMGYDLSIDFIKK
mgnify:FL=1